MVVKHLKKSLCMLSLVAVAVSATACTAPKPSEPTPTPSQTAGKYTAGVYTAKAAGFGGDVEVSVTVDANAITAVEVLSHTETDGIGTLAVDALPDAILAAQGTQVDVVASATKSSNAILEAAGIALAKAAGEEPPVVEKEPTPFEQGWDATPALGITKGDYYKEEGKFGRGAGHIGILEVVVQDDKMVLVEFNERGRPDYHTNEFQDELKRLSEYNFMMGESNGSAWIHGVLLAEQQMMEHQSLTQEVDYVSGATQTVSDGMVPLAKKLDERMSAGTSQKFYRIAEDLGGGLTGILDVVVEDGKIVSCMYDELFASDQDDITDANLKKYYRVSKYESISYKEDSKIGFNWQMDRLNDRVVETQDMFNLTGLLAVEKDDTANKNPAYDNYLALAGKLHEVMVADGVLA